MLPRKRFYSGPSGAEKTTREEQAWDAFREYIGLRPTSPTEMGLEEYMTYLERGAAIREAAGLPSMTYTGAPLPETNHGSGMFGPAEAASTQRRSTFRRLSDWYRSLGDSPPPKVRSITPDSTCAPYGNDEWYQSYLSNEYALAEANYLQNRRYEGVKEKVSVYHPLATLSFADPAAESVVGPPRRDSGISLGGDTVIGESVAAGNDAAVDPSTAQGPSLPDGTTHAGVPIQGYSYYGSESPYGYRPSFGYPGYSGYGPGESYLPPYPDRGPPYHQSYYQTDPSLPTVQPNFPWYAQGGSQYPYNPYGSGLSQAYHPTDPSLTTLESSYGNPTHTTLTNMPIDLATTMQSASHHLALANPRSGTMAGVKTDLSRVLAEGLADRAARTNDPAAVEALTSALEDMVERSNSVYTDEMGKYEANQYGEIRALERGVNDLKKACQTMMDKRTR